MTTTMSIPEDSRPPRAAKKNRIAAKPVSGSANRPPSYMSRKELAWELSSSESTVDELVRRGVIPPPIKLTPGCVRWCWPAVHERLACANVSSDDDDPYMTGAINAT
jgi:predicted DNA-binding transcriptional regulator AlpA